MRGRTVRHPGRRAGAGRRLRRMVDQLRPRPPLTRRPPHQARHRVCPGGRLGSVTLARDRRAGGFHGQAGTDKGTKGTTDKGTTESGVRPNPASELATAAPYRPGELRQASTPSTTRSRPLSPRPPGAHHDVLGLRGHHRWGVGRAQRHQVVHDAALTRRLSQWGRGRLPRPGLRLRRGSARRHGDPPRGGEGQGLPSGADKDVVESLWLPATLGITYQLSVVIEIHKDATGGGDGYLNAVAVDVGIS